MYLVWSVENLRSSKELKYRSAPMTSELRGRVVTAGLHTLTTVSLRHFRTDRTTHAIRERSRRFGEPRGPPTSRNRENIFVLEGA